MPPSYDNLIMQGGGIRCLWQAGFLSAVAPYWDRVPGKIFAVSAGAAIACAFAADRLDAGVEAFREAVSRNRKNFYPSHLLSRKPAFPHAAMYRKVLSDVLNDSGMKALQRGTDVEILLCRPPRRLPAVTVKALLLGIGLTRAFSATRKISSTLIRTSRLSPEFVSVRSCLDARGVTDLVLASSSTPPFTPLFSYQGRHALDGGVLESVPMSGLRPAGAGALVLLTSPHALTKRSSLSQHSGLTYVAPSRHVDGAPWDYANPRLLDAFYSLGKEDGARFVETEAS